MAASGKPVAGAEVRLKPKSLKVITATTNQEGEFEFKEPSQANAHASRLFSEPIFPQRNGQRQRGQSRRRFDCSRITRSASSLKMKVVARADDKPIEKATVHFVWADVKQDHLTDVNGEVAIHGLTPQSWTIETRAKGFAIDKQSVHLNGTDMTNVTAKLAPGAELYGTVRDEAGKGLPRVEICAFAEGINGEQIDYTETSADGSYCFSNLPVTGLTLIVSKEGYTEVRPDLIMGRPGGRQALNVTLPHRPDGGSVRGIVVWTKDGKAIAGASVVNRGGSSNELRENKDRRQKGHYRLDDVYIGEKGYDLFIKAKRFAPQQLKFKPEDHEHPAELNVTTDARPSNSRPAWSMNRARALPVSASTTPKEQLLSGLRLRRRHNNQRRGAL